MTSAGRAAFAAAAGLLLAGMAHAQTVSEPTLRRTTVKVVDHLGNDQQEESIAVYFAGALAGTLHVSPDHPDDSFSASVPVLAELNFALCGKLLKRRPDGGISTHLIDNGGRVESYNDSQLYALTLGDILFTLQDETGRAISTVRQGPACSAAVS